MKILLTAFGNKLQGTMELPDNWDHRDIHLMMDMDQISPMTWTDGHEVADKPITKRARFQFTTMYHVDPADIKSHSAIYRLVEVA